MASVAACPNVVEFKPQVRPLLDRNLMVRVQMRFSLVKSLAKFLKHFLCRRRSQVELSEVRDDVRLPAAIDASPLVPLKAENPEPTMVGIITALCRSPSLLIALPLCLPFVLRAIRSRVAKSPASRRVACTLG